MMDKTEVIEVGKPKARVGPQTLQDMVDSGELRPEQAHRIATEAFGGLAAPRQHVSDEEWDNAENHGQAARLFDMQLEINKELRAQLAAKDAEIERLKEYERAIQLATDERTPTGFISERVIVCSIDQWRAIQDDIARAEKSAAAWEEEARRNAQNAGYWRDEFDKHVAPFDLAPSDAHPHKHANLLTTPDLTDPRLGRK